MSKRARGNGGVFRVKGSRFWWISYQMNGECIRESSGKLTKTEAGNKLKDRRLAISNGNFLGPRIEKITVDELYTYGFRRGELLGNSKRGTEPMRCKQVDLLNNTVCLYSGETKNGEGRVVSLTEECKQLLTELRKGKQPEDFLFTRSNGEVIRDFRGTWEALTKAAGVPGLLFHDLRRSAVRNMVRRGVPQKTARVVSGHKTDAVFSRYNIVSEADIREAALKI